MKNNVLPISLIILLLSTGCASILPTPTPTPLPTLIPISTLTPTITPTPTPTLTPTPTVNPEEFDRWDIMVPLTKEFLPENLNIEKRSDGWYFDWENNRYVVTCGQKITKEENEKWYEWYINNYQVHSSVGTLVTIWFVSSSYDTLFEEMGVLNETKTGLRLIFEPVSCHFVVTNLQTHKLTEEGGRELWRKEKTQPHATLYIHIDPRGVIKASQLDQAIMDRDMEVWCYIYYRMFFNGPFKNFGYYFEDTNVAYTFDSKAVEITSNTFTYSEGFDKCPQLQVTEIKEE